MINNMPKKIQEKRISSEVFSLFFWESKGVYEVYKKKVGSKIQKGILVKKFKEKNKAIKFLDNIKNE